MQEFDNNYKVSDNNNYLDSKVVFGKLMVETRVSGEVVLTSILGNIVETSTDNRYLYLYTSDFGIYTALSKKDNIDILNNNLKKFTYLSIMPKLKEKENKVNLESILAEKFKGYFVK